MENTLEKLARFVSGTDYDTLPHEAVHEAKRLLLDSIGCAIVGAKSDKGRWAMDYARQFYCGIEQASVLGIGTKMSAQGAVFVNAEAINGLDYDAAGKHLPPLVLPGCIAVAEMLRLSGKELICACALALEVGIRIGKSLGSYRDLKDERTSMPPVTGHSCAVFGGAAGVAKLCGQSAEQTAQSMSMAGLLSPVQSQTLMHKEIPTTSCKYVLAGWAAQNALTAPYLIASGHRGCLNILDSDYGYWRFSGSTRWDPEAVVRGLGSDWRFVREVPMKQYPCCRIMHGALDCLAAVIEENSLRFDEIEHIHAYVEATCGEAMFNNPVLESQLDAQFNIKYNMALMASGLKPGAEWQSEKSLRDINIRAFMEKVSFSPHPSYAEAMTLNKEARKSGIEVSARGQIFRRDSTFIKGSNTDDPSTSISDSELIAKFIDNSAWLIGEEKAAAAAEKLMALENVENFAELIPLMCK